MGTAEQIEHGVAVVEVRERRAPVRGAVDGGAERAGQEGRHLGRPGRRGALVGQHHEKPASGLDELAQPLGARPLRRGRVVEHDEHARAQVVGLELPDVLQLHAEARTMADGEGALHVEAAPTRRTVLEHEDGEVAGASTKWNVSSWASASGARTGARGRRRKREGLEGHGGRGIRAQARALRSHRPPVYVERHPGVLHRPRALVHEAGGGDDPLAPRLVVPLHLDSGEGQVRGGAIGDVHPGEGGGRRQLDVVRALPACLLEVGD